MEGESDLGGRSAADPIRDDERKQWAKVGHVCFARQAARLDGMRDELILILAKGALKRDDGVAAYRYASS
jgi:hypothetical protein